VTFTSADVRELRSIRNFNILDPERNRSQEERDKLLHNAFMYASAEEVETYIKDGIPQEWLDAVYSDAKLFGPRFREIVRTLEMFTVAKHDPKVVKAFGENPPLGDHRYKRAVESFQAAGYAAKLEELPLFLTKKHSRWDITPDEPSPKWETSILSIIKTMAAQPYIGQHMGCTIFSYRRAMKPYYKVFGKEIKNINSGQWGMWL